MKIPTRFAHRSISLMLLAAVAGSGCDAADDDPAQSLSTLQEDVLVLVEDVEASEEASTEDVEERTEAAARLEEALDLTAPPDPSADYDPIECQVADIQLSLAQLSFFFVEHYTLQNFQDTGYLVHYNAHLLAIPAHGTATAAAEFDSSVGLWGIVAQIGPTLDWANHTLDHAQNVEDMLSTRLGHVGPNAQLVHDQLDAGIEATQNAIASLEACL